VQKIERQRKRRIDELEKQIEELEVQIAEYEQLLCEPDVYQDHEKVLEITNKNNEAKSKLDEWVEEWTELSDE
jgi:ATP-binding cassette, subfamily F, member 3